jgi:hypothetical protein
MHGGIQYSQPIMKGKRLFNITIQQNINKTILILKQPYNLVHTSAFHSNVDYTHILALHISIALAKIFSVDFLISFSNIIITSTGTMKTAHAKLQSELCL